MGRTVAGKETDSKSRVWRLKICQASFRRLRRVSGCRRTGSAPGLELAGADFNDARPMGSSGCFADAIHTIRQLYVGDAKNGYPAVVPFKYSVVCEAVH